MLMRFGALGVGTTHIAWAWQFVSRPRSVEEMKEKKNRKG